MVKPKPFGAQPNLALLRDGHAMVGHRDEAPPFAEEAHEPSDADCSEHWVITVDFADEEAQLISPCDFAKSQALGDVCFDFDVEGRHQCRQLLGVHLGDDALLAPFHVALAAPAGVSVAKP